MRCVLSLLTVAALALPAFADSPEALPAGAKVVALDVRPAAVELTTPFAYAQLLVIAKLDTGEAVDATRVATIIPPPPFVTVSRTGVVRPVSDGTGAFEISVGDQRVRVPVVVSGQKANAPVSF